MCLTCPQHPFTGCVSSDVSNYHLTLSQRLHLFTHSWPPALTSAMPYLPGPRSLLLTLCSMLWMLRTCRQWHKKVRPWPDSNLAWWLTMARCGRSSNIQTQCHHAQMSAWQGSAVPCRLFHTGHRCCRQAASQVSHTETYKLSVIMHRCHDIGYPLLDAEHSLCTAPWSGTPCRTTSVHSRTMNPLDRA